MNDELTKLLFLVAVQGALGMALVAGIRATLKTLTSLQSMLVAFSVSLITCAAWELYISAQGIPTPWQALPIKVLVVGLISMGWWSGSKATTGNS